MPPTPPPALGLVPHYRLLMSALSGVSVSAFLLLVFLVWRRSPAAMRDYRFLIINFTVSPGGRRECDFAAVAEPIGASAIACQL